MSTRYFRCLYFSEPWNTPGKSIKVQNGNYFYHFYYINQYFLIVNKKKKLFQHIVTIHLIIKIIYRFFIYISTYLYNIFYVHNLLSVISIANMLISPCRSFADHIIPDFKNLLKSHK
jgi:presenilin-like A22 family membrane protease